MLFKMLRSSAVIQHLRRRRFQQQLLPKHQQQRSITTPPFAGKTIPAPPTGGLKPIPRRKRATTKDRFGMMPYDYSIPPPLYQTPPPPPIKTPYAAMGTAGLFSAVFVWFYFNGKNDALEMWEAMESGALFIEDDDDDDDDDDDNDNE
jgi:hypothetical protein